MPQILPSSDGASVISLIKQNSGKRIETRRRRDRISQAMLAAAVGRSSRWLREIEAGIASSALEDHIRCAHALGMSTAHIFVPLLFVEHNMPVPRELLMLDDLWDAERACLSILYEHQSAAQSRQALRAIPLMDPKD
ncbi:helix-turn-helix domain-containing protein [Novosphingobium sp. G106]|nr:helix-turn-helix domain-containing protein [Novosphingobium sp. G106]